MKTYKEMALHEQLKKALETLKFDKPTKIQEAVIPLALDGIDVMACAETGSGKTGAFGIPIVQMLLENTEARALILTPTRELADQVAEVMRSLTKYCTELTVTSIVGGADIRKQLKALKRNPRIIVATPGRLTDHLRRRSIKLDTTATLVLDEGDRMLDMGFAPQLDAILKFLPEKRQTSLYTATLPDKVRKLAEKYLYKPKKVNVGRTSLPVASIRQAVVQVQFKEKDDRIIDELNARKGSVIVFARTKHRTDILARNLSKYGFSVDLIHGGRTQGQRNTAIRNFKSGKARILCATDVAARGIDVPQVEHVINFDIPMMDEDYVHRIGRTARNGADGEALSFVTPEERHAWNGIVRKYKIIGATLDVPARSKNSGRGNSSGRGFAKRRSSSDDGFSGRRGQKRSFSKRRESSDDDFSGRRDSKRGFSKRRESSDDDFSGRRDSNRSFSKRRESSDEKFSDRKEPKRSFSKDRNTEDSYSKKKSSKKKFSSSGPSKKNSSRKSFGKKSFSNKAGKTTGRQQSKW